MIATASVAVAVERVGTACTVPDSRSTWFLIIWKPAARRSSPPQSFRCVARAAGVDGGSRAGRRATPWCAGTFGASVRTRRRRRPGPPRRRGAGLVTPSWRAQESPERGAPTRAARRRRGCRAGQPRLVRGDSPAKEETATYPKCPTHGRVRVSN